MSENEKQIKLFDGTVLTLQHSLQETEKKTTELLKDVYQDDVPHFWENEKYEHIYVPVEDGAIRVIHIKPDKPLNKRPIVLVPGYAVAPITFQDFYEVMHDKYEY